MPRIICDPYANAAYQKQLWTPAALGANRITAWYDLSSFQFTLDGSAGVSTLFDLNARKRDASQATSANRPVYAANIQNARGGMKFTRATGHSLDISAFTTGDFTVYAVAAKATLSNYRSIWHGTAATGTPFFGYSDTGTLNINNDNIAVIVSASVADGTHVLSGRSGYTAGNHMISIDGSQTTASLAGSFSRGFTNIGGYLGGAGVGFNDYMFELLGYEGRHTDAEMRNVEGYLAWRWGLVGQMIASHPFKNRPPLLGD